MRRLYVFTLLLLLVGFLSSCVKLQVNYPEINLYTLSQPENRAIIASPIDCSIQIRDVEMPDSQRGNKIMLMEDGVIRELYYNRWITSFDDLVTDYFITRLSKSEGFSKGIITDRTLQKPDYILEARILECMAENDEKPRPDEYYIEITMNFRLIKTSISQKGYTDLMIKSYELRIERDDEDVETIAPAYNLAMNQIGDELLGDLIKAIQADKEDGIMKFN